MIRNKDVMIVIYFLFLFRKSRLEHSLWIFNWVRWRCHTFTICHTYHVLRYENITLWLCWIKRYNLIRQRGGSNPHKITIFSLIDLEIKFIRFEIDNNIWISSSTRSIRLLFNLFNPADAGIYVSLLYDYIPNKHNFSFI